MIIAPSILSMDFSKMNQQIEEIEATKAKWLHFDVMDGHFVKNLTFGPDLLKGIRKLSSLYMDVHIMVEDPEYYAGVFMDAGADGITFHAEACKSEEEIRKIIRLIKSRGKKAGLSIRPTTSTEVILPFLDELDLVLIMSVNPGFGGQAFIPEAATRIRGIKQAIDQHGYSVLIEVDGGINEETAKIAKEAGVDVIVAGSYVFKNHISEAVERLC